MSKKDDNKDSDAKEPASLGLNLIQDIVNLAILLGLVLVFFSDVILHGQVFFAGDIMNVYTPWQQYNQEALASGRMPLWCDDFFMGFPLFAESQGALFYPPTRLIYFLVPAVHAFSFDVLFHFLLAGWFQYFLARTLRLSPGASLMTAIAFAFSGLFLSLPINFTIFRSIIWIPLIFMFLTLGARRGSLIYPLLAAISFVFQMMGGSLQVAGITGLALVPWVIFLIISPGKDKQPSLVPLLQFILTLLLAAGLYMFQLLPTLELMHYAWRGTQGDYSVAAAFSFPPEHFIDAILPTFYGIWANGSMLPVTPTANFFPYIGLVPLLLIIPALSARKRGVFVCLILVVFFLLLAIGKFGVVYPAIYKTVPFFDKFRAPDRFWMIAVFAGSLLAGFGFQRLVSDVESDKNGKSANVAGIIGFFLLLGTLFTLGAMLVPQIQSIWKGLIDSGINSLIANRRAGIEPVVLDRWVIHLAKASFHALLAVTAFHFAIALLSKKGRGSILAGTLILITVVDLFFMSFNVPALRTSGVEFYKVPPRSAEVLRLDGEPNRFCTPFHVTYARSVFNFNDPSGEKDALWYNGGGSNNISDYMAMREGLSPNIFMHWGLKSSNGFASLFLDDYFKLEGASKQQVAVFMEGADIDPEVISDWADRTLLIDLMASRYVLTPIEFVPTDRFQLIDSGAINIYHNRREFQRAWIARPQTVLAESRNSFNQLIQAEIDPRSTLILDPAPRNPRIYSGGAEGNATARIRPIGGAEGARARGGAIRDEQVLIEVSTPQPAYLILADTFYPGWQAEIDGAPVDIIYRAFGYFRAIEIPAGDHLVRFEYRPASYNTGRTFSIITLATFILLLIVQGLFFSRARSSKKET